MALVYEEFLDNKLMEVKFDLFIEKLAVGGGNLDEVSSCGGQ